MTSAISLTVERVIPGPIDAVFDAWLDPGSLMRWMTPGPGISVPQATTEPRVGGRFRIVMKSGAREIPHEGEYRVIDRPRRLVFTWKSEPAGDTLVTIQFVAVSERRTKVILTHERFATETSRDSHRNGWTAVLEAMDRTMEAIS
jgi:uncharacterized protein YndB with AHSA1/START domain